MRVLVSSARAAYGDGYGTILAFDLTGDPLGSFTEDDRVVDPRGLCVSSTGELLYANCGDHRIVALDHSGQVLRDTGPIDTIEPGGGVFGPDAMTPDGNVVVSSEWPFGQALEFFG